MFALSKGEQKFVADGIPHDVRVDGRTRLAFRPFVVEVGEHLIPTAYGASMLKVGCIGSNCTQIFVGLKAEVTEPEVLNPDRGFFAVTVDCSATLSPDITGGGAGAQEISVQLTRSLERILEDAKCIDLKKLCIVPGRYCWRLFLDAHIMEADGNLLDALTIAARAALLSLKLPALKLVPGDGGTTDIEIPDEASMNTPSVKRFDAVNPSRVPISITLTKFSDSDSNMVVDCTFNEEQCAGARLSVCVAPDSLVPCVWKTGVGPFSVDCLPEALQLASKIGNQLLAQIDTKLARARAPAEGAAAASAEGGEAPFILSNGSAFDAELLADAAAEEGGI